MTNSNTVTGHNILTACVAVGFLPNRIVDEGIDLSDRLVLAVDGYDYSLVFSGGS